MGSYIYRISLDFSKENIMPYFIRLDLCEKNVGHSYDLTFFNGTTTRTKIQNAFCSLHVMK